MRHAKQILACMLAASMMISGMTGIAGASEISASGSTQQVSTEAEAASAEGSGSPDKEKEYEKTAEGDSERN